MSDKQHYNYYYNYYSYEIEEMLKSFFVHAGYFVMDMIIGSEKRPSADWILGKDGKSFYALLKCSQKIDASNQMVLASVNALAKWYKTADADIRYIPLLVVVGVVSDEVKQRVKDNPLTCMVEIWDIRNLLEFVQDDIERRNRFVELLPFSIEQFISTNNSKDLQNTEEVEILDELIQRVESWVSPKDKGKSYEDLCVDVLKSLFYDDLTKWTRQKSSDGGLFRFDLICKIKNEQNRDFWSMAERFFLTKYVVFEFKDYENAITQREVFTTVKYLYPKALRGIAILISATGIDEHGVEAIKGILRDEGKLIIALDNKDLVAMLKLKKEHDSPADYLSDKLDTLLIELEK